MSKIRLVGDVHGDGRAINQMLQSTHHYDLTIQIGDFGIGFGAERYLHNSDDQFKILFGNHDNYDILAQYPENLGRFGILDFDGKRIFYVGGAWSIDWANRVPGLSWWSNEELNISEIDQCLDLWEKECKSIDYVITHDCPIMVGHAILGYMPYENNTNRALYEMWKFHEPSEWFYGHWHMSRIDKIGNTIFRCLNINEDCVIEW